MKSAQGQPRKKPKPRGALARRPFPAKYLLCSTFPVTSSFPPSPGCPPNLRRVWRTFPRCLALRFEETICATRFCHFSSLSVVKRENASITFSTTQSQPGFSEATQPSFSIFKVRSENLAPKYQYLNILFPD